jgi:hypothetical protein
MTGRGTSICSRLEPAPFSSPSTVATLAPQTQPSHDHPEPRPPVAAPHGVKRQTADPTISSSGGSGTDIHVLAETDRTAEEAESSAKTVWTRGSGDSKRRKVKSSRSPDLSDEPNRQNTLDFARRERVQEPQTPCNSTNSSDIEFTGRYSELLPQTQGDTLQLASTNPPSLWPEIR